MHRRTALIPLAAALAGAMAAVLPPSLALAAPATATPAAPAAGSPTASATALPQRINLPDGFRPEGIAISTPDARLYAGSLADGDIYTADLRTGRGRVLAQGPGTPSVGLALDRRGRLFVAGGPAGDARVIDTDTGAVLASWQFAQSPTFVNDVVLTPRWAWFTDSQRPFLYGVPIARDGRLGGPADVVRLRLRGQWEQVPDAFNANGIVRTPDRTGLLVVNSTLGALFRVDPNTGRAVKVNLDGDTVQFGDGMLRQGKTLYVVQNQLNVITKVSLNFRGTRGELAGGAATSDFDVPTTIAGYGRHLYVVNARFGTTPTPDTEYWVTRVPRF